MFLEISRREIMKGDDYQARIDNMMRREEITQEMSRRRCITDDEMNRGER